MADADLGDPTDRVDKVALLKFLTGVPGRRWIQKRVVSAIEDLQDSEMSADVKMAAMKDSLGWARNINPGNIFGMESKLAIDIFGAQQDHVLCSDAELSSLLTQVTSSDTRTYAKLLIQAWKRAYLPRHRVTQSV